MKTTLFLCLALVLIIMPGCNKKAVVVDTQQVEANKRKDYKPSEQAVRESDLYLLEAKKHYAQGNYKSVQKYCEKALEFNHGNWEAHYYLGLASQKRREYRVSIEVLSIGLKYSPENDYIKSEIHFAIGISWEKLGDLEKAENQFELALSYNPDNHSALQAKNRIQVQKTLKNWGKDTKYDYDG
jgi:tetratricopeptide (TPR) repeat protein